MTWLQPANPLWLPRGTVRSLLTFGVLGCSIVQLFLTGGAENAVPEWWVALTVFVVKDYFAVRDSERGREEMQKVLDQATGERAEERKINATVIDNMTDSDDEDNDRTHGRKRAAEKE
jgi:hypothetical protein